jgi:hypothetical protein
MNSAENDLQNLENLEQKLFEPLITVCYYRPNSKLVLLFFQFVLGQVHTEGQALVLEQFFDFDE